MIHLLFALLITQVQPVQPPASFSCYTYPPSLRITPTNANGLVCPALEPGDGSAKPGWTREYRCSVSGNTATCGPLENPGVQQVTSPHDSGRAVALRRYRHHAGFGELFRSSRLSGLHLQHVVEAVEVVE